MLRSHSKVSDIFTAHAPHSWSGKSPAGSFSEAWEIVLSDSHMGPNQWTINRFRSQKSTSRIHALGHGFDGGKLLHDSQCLGEHIAKQLADTQDNKSYTALKELVGRINGNFAVIVETVDWVFAAVDRLRSMPLFYGMVDNKIVIGDNALNLAERIGCMQFDEIALKEFLLAGFVTGDETLYKQLKQIQAGEYIFVERSKVPKIFCERYYRYTHDDSFEKPMQELYAPAESMLNQVFERFAKSIQGRQVVIPLSGGRDSRLIAAMLKVFGLKDVVCFSYGRCGNWESEISRCVAERLGYKWEFVRESRRRWRRWHRTPNCRAYYMYGHNLCSCVILQDWPAVWQLKERGKIADDAVFVPGHTGDVLAGSHIPLSLQGTKPVGTEKLISFLIERHYSLWNWHKCREQLWPVFTERILSRLSGFNPDGPEEAADALECWDWQERQAKFIVNSVRAYEFWGHDWRIPLWDNQMMDFFSHMPLKYRIGKVFYNTFLDTTLFSNLGIADFPGIEIPVCQKPPTVRDASGRIVLPLLFKNAPGMLLRFLTLKPRCDLGISSVRDSLQFKRLYHRNFGMKSFGLFSGLSIDAHITCHALRLIEKIKPKNSEAMLRS